MKPVWSFSDPALPRSTSALVIMLHRFCSNFFSHCPQSSDGPSIAKVRLLDNQTPFAESVRVLAGCLEKPLVVPNPPLGSVGSMLQPNGRGPERPLHISQPPS